MLHFKYFCHRCLNRHCSLVGVCDADILQAGFALYGCKFGHEVVEHKVTLHLTIENSIQRQFQTCIVELDSVGSFTYIGRISIHIHHLSIGKREIDIGYVSLRL